MYTNKDALNILDVSTKADAILHIVESLMFINQPSYSYVDKQKEKDKKDITSWLNAFDFKFLSMEETTDAIMDVVENLLTERLSNFSYADELKELDKETVRNWLQQDAVCV